MAPATAPYAVVLVSRRVITSSGRRPRGRQRGRMTSRGHAHQLIFICAYIAC